MGDCPNCPKASGVKTVRKARPLGARSSVALGADPSHDFATGLVIKLPKTVVAKTRRKTITIYRADARVMSAELDYLKGSTKYKWIFEPKADESA